MYARVREVGERKWVVGTAMLLVCHSSSHCTGYRRISDAGMCLSLDSWVFAWSYTCSVNWNHICGVLVPAYSPAVRFQAIHLFLKLFRKEWTPLTIAQFKSLNMYFLAGSGIF